MSYSRCSRWAAWPVIFWVASCPSPAEQPQPHHAPAVVLVHGAFVDGSSWREVIPLLQAHGLTVVAVQNPLTSLEDDVKATKAVLDRQDAPVILVGHSWGGAVITQAGMDPKVAALVFVAAVVPDRGQSVADLMSGSPTMPAGSEFRPDGAGSLFLTPKGMAEDFAQDLPGSEARVLSATEIPISGQAFHDRLSQAAWRSKPTWYIVASRDRALSPDLERKMAKDIGARTVTVPSSHLMVLSQPRKVAEVILAAARATAR